LEGEAVAPGFTFAAYGQLLALHGTTGAALLATAALTSLGYSGEHFDAKVQQQYLRARWYNPANGQFNRLDPFAGNMQDPQSLHKYAYVHGDPVNGVDPTGLSLLGGTIGSIGIARAIATVAVYGAVLGGTVGFAFGAVNANGERGAWNALQSIAHYTVLGIVAGGLAGAAVGVMALTIIPALTILASGGILLAALRYNDVSFDEFFSALPYLPYLGTPKSWIRSLSPKIKEQALRFDVPEELIASVLMYELSQYNVGDSVFDFENFSGNDRSIGVAQLTEANVREWVPSKANASRSTIRNMRIDPEQSVELLAEAISFWSQTYGSNISGTQVSQSTWDGYLQNAKEQVVLYYASAKDELINGVGWGNTRPSAHAYGVGGLRTIQRQNLLQ
jgi:RHS repeat-associated protein